MATQTQYYNLIKPAGNENVDINVINGNMDLIDTVLHGKADGLTISYLAATLLSTGWIGDAAPYTYNLTLEGITVDSNGIITVADTATDEQYESAVYAMLRKVAQAENSLTIKAYGEKPTVDIPITVRLG